MKAEFLPYNQEAPDIITWGLLSGVLVWLRGIGNGPYSNLPNCLPKVTLCWLTLIMAPNLKEVQLWLNELQSRSGKF